MVDMIVQNISHSGHASLSFTVPRVDLDQCLLLTREVLEEWDNVKLSFDRDIAKLSIMGIGLRSHTGVGEKAFRDAAHSRLQQAQIQELQRLDRVARQVVEAHAQVQSRQQQITIAEQAVRTASASLQRNLQRIPYVVLLPSRIPQSINI